MTEAWMNLVTKKQVKNTLDFGDKKRENLKNFKRLV